jgi:outer membrane lipoprotein carrier protein
MKSTLIAVIFLLTCSISFAQNQKKQPDAPTAAAAVQQTDKQAQDILKGVTDKYKSYKSVKATFIVTIENPDDKSKDVQNGTIYLKGDKYKLTVAGQEVISDGKTVWTYVKDGNEVQVNNVKKDDNAITPSNIFTIYEKGFLFRFAGEQNDKGTAYQFVELVPVDTKKKNYFKIKLTINKNDKFITSAKIFNKNGSIHSITVDKFTPDAATDESLFTFNAANYPGAEIIDLR